jgi:hypothetical protein
MSLQSQMEREKDDIDRREAEGVITRKQADQERRELHRDYRGAAEEAAEQTYHDELER